MALSVAKREGHFRKGDEFFANGWDCRACQLPFFMVYKKTRGNSLLQQTTAGRMAVIPLLDAD